MSDGSTSLIAITNDVGDLGIAGSSVVEGAVRLDVRKLGILRAAHIAESTKLVPDVEPNLFRREAQLSAAKAGNVGIRRVRADRDAASLGRHYRVSHCRGVAGVKATRYVGGRHHVEQHFVL